jgi:hypothetical protein
MASIREIRNAYKIFVGKPEGRDHSEDKRVDVFIKIDLWDKKWDVVDWTHLARFRDQGGILRTR